MSDGIHELKEPLEEPGSKKDNYNRSLFINSTVAFALAAVVMIFIHEFGHALAAISFGLHPVVRPFSVDYGISTNTQNIVIELTGPLVSLLSGFLFLAMDRGNRGDRGFWGLFWLWLGLQSIQEFTGYLFTAPFGRVGDISDALHNLNAPLWVGFVSFAVGCAGTFLLGRVATVRFLRFTDPSSAIPNQMRSVGLFAWLAGVLLELILSIGSFDASVVGIFEAFGILASGIYLTSVRYYLPRVKGRGKRQGLQFPVFGVVLLFVVSILRLVVFVPGLHF
jgi:hypothetical protein